MITSEYGSDEVVIQRIKGSLIGVWEDADADLGQRHLGINFDDGRELRIHGEFVLELIEPDPCPACGR